jgi:predicted restriction endonuclease
MAKGKTWSREELLMAMNLYCKLPFGRLHGRNPEIQALAAALGRTPGSVAMKLVNLASLDPLQQARGIRGLSAVSKIDRAVWEEFNADWDGMAAESEALMARLVRAVTEGESRRRGEREEKRDGGTFEGPTEGIRSSRVRLAQAFFRRAVLVSYGCRCCITGNPVPDLLTASHILPWATHPQQRANPRNGLCLAKTQDAAFDHGFITLDDSLRVCVSEQLRKHGCEPAIADQFLQHEGRPIRMPERFRPEPDFLAYHREHVFRG